MIWGRWWWASGLQWIQWMEGLRIQLSLSEVTFLVWPCVALFRWRRRLSETQDGNIWQLLPALHLSIFLCSFFVVVVVFHTNHQHIAGCFAALRINPPELSWKMPWSRIAYVRRHRLSSQAAPAAAARDSLVPAARLRLDDAEIESILNTVKARRINRGPQWVNRRSPKRDQSTNGESSAHGVTWR